MKKIWKWIVGILIVLVVVAALVAVPFAVRQARLTNLAGNVQPMLRNGNAPANPHMNNGNFAGGQPGMPGRANGGQRPMLGGGRGFARFGGRLGLFAMGFMFFGGLLRLVVPLGLLALVIYAAYQMGKRSVKPTVIAAPAPAPVDATPPADNA
jgi:hypothetical protein